MSEFWTNVKAMWKKFSFWVAAMGASIVAAWMAMPADMQAKVVEVFPMIGTVGPVIWMVSFIVARATPQK